MRPPQVRLTVSFRLLSPGEALTSGKQSVSVMQRKRLFSDSKANASFAFAAVFILISVTASSAVVSKCESSAKEFELPGADADSIGRIRNTVASEMELVIQGAVSKALSNLRRTIDVPRLGEEISNAVRYYISASYPKRIGGFDVDLKVENLTALLSQRCDARNPESPVPSAITVQIDLEMSISDGSTVCRVDVCISKEVVSPSLFLSSKLDHVNYSASTSGRIGNIVRSILTQLVQLRVLQGHASPDDRGTGALRGLLTAADVETAVNLALILQEVSDFGSSDQSSWGELQERAPEGQLGQGSEWFSSAVDPFKTYMMLRGGEAEGGINLREYALQTLFSLVDQMVVRFLEYSHLIDLADGALQAGRTIDGGWRDLVEFLTGVDSRFEDTIDWVACRLDAIDTPYAAWKGLFDGSQDLSFNPMPSSIKIYDLSGAIVQVQIGTVPFWLDLPTTSILNSSAWKEFGGILSGSALTAGAAAEKVAMDLCRQVADSIPPDQIYGSLSSPRPYIQSILDTIGLRLSSIAESALSKGDSASVPQSYDSGLAILREFIEEHWSSIFPYAEALAFGRAALPSKLADTAIIEDPSNIPPYWKQQVSSNIASSLGGALANWAAALGESINRTADAMKSIILLSIDNNLHSQERSGGQIYGSIMKWIADGVPFSLMKAGLQCQTRSLSTQIRNLSDESQLNESVGAVPARMLSLQGDASAGYNSSSASASLLPRLTQSPAYLEGMELPPSSSCTVDNVDCSDRLVISISRPDCEDPFRPKSTHYTALGAVSSYPYETNWVVNVRGGATLTATDGFNPGTRASREVRIDLEIPITAVSGWPLMGAKYENSNNLIGDACTLLSKVKNQIWEYISPFIAAHQKALNILLDSLSDISKYLSGFAEQVAKALSAFGDFLVSSCMKILDKIRNSPLWQFIKLYVNTVGTVEVHFSYGPATIIVSCSLPDLLFRKAKDLIRVTVVLNLDKMKASLGFRIAELSNGLPDIIVNSTVKVGDLKIEMRLDPLMGVRDHLFELRGSWRGFCIQAWSPEVNDYKRFSVQLVDIPLLGPVLSNIPIPALGISLSINAGVILKYNLPFCNQLVINEVELNPPNKDSGKEWVELYNPLDREVSVEGWTIETMHGEISLITLSGTISKKGTRAFVFPRASLDNGNSGDTFAMGDSIMLRDPDGQAIDITPLISDTSNDGKTWHRSWDGAPKWIFGPATKGRSNGNALLHTYPELALKLCVDAIYLAIQDEMDNVSLSIDFVINLLRSFLRELIGQVAEFAASMVEEASLFIEVGVNDLSGTLGGGFRFKVTADGEIFRQMVMWFAEQVAKLFGRILFNREISPSLLKGCNPAEAIYVGFDIFGKIGMPRWIKSLFSVTGAPTELRLALTFLLSFASIAKIFGMNLGKFCLKFGLHVDDLPGMSLLSPLSLHRDRVDLWLLKGQLTIA